jgi:hypothetical protein
VWWHGEERPPTVSAPRLARAGAGHDEDRSVALLRCNASVSPVYQCRSTATGHRLETFTARRPGTRPPSSAPAPPAGAAAAAVSGTGCFFRLTRVSPPRGRAGEHLCSRRPPRRPAAPRRERGGEGPGGVRGRERVRVGEEPLRWERGEQPAALGLDRRQRQRRPLSETERAPRLRVRGQCPERGRGAASRDQRPLVQAPQHAGQERRPAPTAHAPCLARTAAPDPVWR